MKDKHIHNPEDSALLKLVYARIDKGLEQQSGRKKLLLIFKFLVYASLMGLAYSGIYAADNIPVFILSYVLFGILAVLLGFNFAHDFSHNTMFRKKQIDNLCFTFIYTLLGAHAEAWKYRHVHSHHYAPNVKEYDSDLQITSLIRVEPDAPYKSIHRFQHFYAPLAYMGYSLYWVLIKDFVLLFKTEPGQRKGPGYIASFLLQKAFYAGYLFLLPLWFSGHTETLVIVGFLLMHMVQSLFLLLTFFMTHHVESTSYFAADEKGYIQESWMGNQIKSSNDFYPFSKTANFIFGGFNNHIAHHLFPHINHVYYPELNKILYKTLQEHNILPNQTGYFSGVWSHLKHLKNLSVS